MIKKSLLFILVLGFFLKENSIAQTSKDYAVLATATVSKSPVSITLHWPLLDTGFTKYVIYKKMKDDKSWGKIFASLPVTDTNYIDTAVVVGKIYEYAIHKVNGNSSIGMSYLLSGIDVPAVHSRGNILMLVESKLQDSLSAELKSYMLELSADGWKVYPSLLSMIIISLHWMNDAIRNG